MENRHYYNEFDPFAAAWLGNLQRAKEIPAGRVDTRSIVDVKPEDLADAVQCHFFAGIGGWARALRIAGWKEEREVWTASCPCQPFSAAGKGEGQEDERHLWPTFFKLVVARRPAAIFGEQVASASVVGKAGGRTPTAATAVWLDGVRADLEGAGYTFGATVLGAHSVNAPHIRQRVFWGAALVGRLAEDPDGRGRGRGRDGDTPWDDGKIQATGLRPVGGVANNNNTDEIERTQAVGEAQPPRGGVALRLGNHSGEGRDKPSRDEHGTPVGGEGRGLAPLADEARRLADDDDEGLQGNGRSRENRGPLSVRDSAWFDFRTVLCSDGKARRTGARVFPLAHGIPRGVGQSGTWRPGLARGASKARIGMLKGSGNAILPELGAQFILAFQEVVGLK